MNWKRAFVILICSVLGPLTFIHIFDSIMVNLQGMELVLSFKLALKGSTTINLPPIGILKAYTHTAPIAVNIMLQNIDLDLIKVIIDRIHDKNELFLLFREDVIRAVQILAVKTVALGMTGATFAAFFLKLKKKEFMVCIFISLLLVIALLSSVYITYDIMAFDKPEYFGTLKAAPWLIGIWNKGLSQINELGQQLKNMSDGISMVFSRMDNLASTEESMVRVLHVSDIHNNPAAFEFMEQIIKNFNVDFVIDTGDITDYGTFLEDMVIKQLSQLPVDYIFVAGNHDSPKTLELLKTVDNVTILDGEITTIKGIDILGFSDVVSDTTDIVPSGEAEIMKLYLKIREKLYSLNKMPDILVVHNPKSTESLSGLVPIILNGHVHKASLKEENNSLIINAGTTGAAGIRGLQSKGEIPYSAVLLYFNKSKGLEKPQLFAADIIKISNIKAGFQVERIFFDQEDGK